jgi:hypothetical protein
MTDIVFTEAEDASTNAAEACAATKLAANARAVGSRMREVGRTVSAPLAMATAIIGEIKPSVVATMISAALNALTISSRALFIKLPLVALAPPTRCLPPWASIWTR